MVCRKLSQANIRKEILVKNAGWVEVVGRGVAEECRWLSVPYKLIKETWSLKFLSECQLTCLAPLCVWAKRCKRFCTTGNKGSQTAKFFSSFFFFTSQELVWFDQEFVAPLGIMKWLLEIGESAHISNRISFISVLRAHSTVMGTAVFYNFKCEKARSYSYVIAWMQYNIKQKNSEKYLKSMCIYLAVEYYPTLGNKIKKHPNQQRHSYSSFSLNVSKEFFVEAVYAFDVKLDQGFNK